MSKKIGCPICTNKRLFDMVSAQQLELLIKCPKCKNTINITVTNNKLIAQSTQ